MGVIVTFDYGAWSARYMDLAPYINSNTATECFEEATLYQANDGSGPVNDPTRALQLLNMLTAHIAAIDYPVTGNPSSPNASSTLVGRISDATEGSVTVSAQNDYPPGTVQWFQQTKYGSAWYAATAQYRRMKYRPGNRWGYGLGGRRFGRFL